MPGYGRKKDHHRGSNRVAGNDEVAARNANFETIKAESDAVRAKKKAEKDGKDEVLGSSEDEASADEPAPKPKPKGSSAPATVNNPNHGPARDVAKEGVELSRKEREEIAKQAARRRYEELHKQGKTDEAKADLGRLEEVKKRREEAKKKKEEEDEAKKAVADSKSKKGGLTAEVKDALGGAAARTKGHRSQAKKTDGDDKAPSTVRTSIPAAQHPDLYNQYAASQGDIKKEEKTVDNKDGSIQSCRAAEDDFM